jgi:cell wall-associated NlpC family hydrolase
LAGSSIRATVSANVTTRTRTAGGPRRWACLVGCLLLLCPLHAAPASADPADDKRAEARRIAAELDDLGRSVSVLAEEMDGGRLRADDLAAEAAAAERDLAKAEAEAVGARTRLAAEAVDTYVQGGMDLGATPMTANDGDPLRRRQYAMTLQAQRSDVLDAAKAQAAIVREKRDRLDKARGQAEGAVAAVERARREAEEAAARLEAAQGRIDSELAGLVQQEQDEQAAVEAADVQRTLAARNPASPVATLPAPPRPSATALAAPAAPVATTRPPTAGPGAPPTTRAPTPTTTRPAPDAGNEAPTPSPGAAAAIAEARRQIGKPYRYGGSGPDSFDCSGLTAWAWRAGGRSLPHSSGAQYASLPKVNSAEARPGDIFAFGSPIHHVGLYIGGGQMIEASQTGTPVRYAAAYRRDLKGVVRP